MKGKEEGDGRTEGGEESCCFSTSSLLFVPCGKDKRERMIINES